MWQLPKSGGIGASAPLLAADDVDRKVPFQFGRVLRAPDIVDVVAASAAG